MCTATCLSYINVSFNNWTFFIALPILFSPMIMISILTQCITHNSWQNCWDMCFQYTRIIKTLLNCLKLNLISEICLFLFIVPTVIKNIYASLTDYWRCVCLHIGPWKRDLTSQSTKWSSASHILQQFSSTDYPTLMSLCLFINEYTTLHWINA